MLKDIFAVIGVATVIMVAYVAITNKPLLDKVEQDVSNNGTIGVGILETQDCGCEQITYNNCYDVNSFDVTPYFKAPIPTV